MTATPQYAKPVEGMEWMTEERPSAYVVSLPRVRTIIAHELPYDCKFYVSNLDDDDTLVEPDIIYRKMEISEAGFSFNDESLALRISARQQLLSIATYKDDWDGYGAIRPLSECLSHALDIIDDANISTNHISDIYPNPNGTITIEWEQNGNEIGLELGNSEFSYYTHIGDHHSYNNNKQYVADEIVRLAEFVSFLG